MAKRPSPNSHKPWTDNETCMLRRRARAGVPRREIARELGRSANAVGNYAWKIGVKIETLSETSVEPQSARPPPAAGHDRPGPSRADDVCSAARGKPSNWTWSMTPGGNAAMVELRLKVVRLARPTCPWIWEIRRDGEAAVRGSSTMGYRSAEDAWVAGKAVLASCGRRGDPKR